jgi:hypothetical protein
VQEAQERPGTGIHHGAQDAGRLNPYLPKGVALEVLSKRNRNKPSRDIIFFPGGGLKTYYQLLRDAHQFFRLVPIVFFCHLFSRHFFSLKKSWKSTWKNILAESTKNTIPY